MATPTTNLHPRRDRAQIGISAFLIALSAFIFWQVQLIPADGGYSAVGPRFTPMLIGAGLLVVGIALLYQSVTTGWRGLEGVDALEPMHGPAFLWIAGGLTLHMIVIGTIGFTLASMLVFTMVARGFGSRRVARDAVIGFVLGAIVFLFFTRVLGLTLPASPLAFV